MVGILGATSGILIQTLKMIVPSLALTYWSEVNTSIRVSDNSATLTSLILGGSACFLSSAHMVGGNHEASGNKRIFFSFLSALIQLNRGVLFCQKRTLSSMNDNSFAGLS